MPGNIIDQRKHKGISGGGTGQAFSGFHVPKGMFAQREHLQGSYKLPPLTQ